MSTVGDALTGYVQGGGTGAFMATGQDLINGLLGELATTAYFPGINSATNTAMSELLSEIPDALKQEEALCGTN